MKFLWRNILGPVLAATLAACGGGEDPSNTGSSASTASTSSAIQSVDSGAGAGPATIALQSPASGDTSAGSTSGTGGRAYAMAYVPPPGASSGCGQPQGIYSGERWITSDGVQRQYVVRVPNGYDPSKPYPLIFAFHPRTGNSWAVWGDNFYGMLQQYGENAIYVAPQGLVDSDPGLQDATGWKNTNDRDMRFVRSMLDQVKQGLCVDTQHVYAVGFSYGGMMSTAIGCEMGDVFRGIAVAAGALKSGCADSSYKVAAIGFHALDDYYVTYQEGEAARNVFLSRNHCSAQTITVGANGCQLYLGCDGNKNVVWCPRPTGGHSYPSYFAVEAKAMFDRN